jgi:hypothetical protein
VQASLGASFTLQGISQGPPGTPPPSALVRNSTSLRPILHGWAARAGVYPMGLRGFSTRLAHCSGGTRQRPSSAPPLQPSPSTWPLSRLYALSRRADPDVHGPYPPLATVPLSVLVARRGSASFLLDALHVGLGLGDGGLALGSLAISDAPSLEVLAVPVSFLVLGCTSSLDEGPQQLAQLGRSDQVLPS